MRKKVLVIEDDGEIRPGVVDEAEIEPYGDSAAQSAPDLDDVEKLSGKPKRPKQKRAEEPDRAIANRTFLIAGVLLIVLLTVMFAFMFLSLMSRTIF
jgi:hypothetical protein